MPGRDGTGPMSNSSRGRGKGRRCDDWNGKERYRSRGNCYLDMSDEESLKLEKANLLSRLDRVNDRLDKLSTEEA